MRRSKCCKVILVCILSQPKTAWLGVVFQGKKLDSRNVAKLSRCNNQAGWFFFNSNRWNSCCKLISVQTARLATVQTIGCYTVMSSYQRKQLRCQFSLSKKSSPNAMNKFISAQGFFFVSFFPFRANSSAVTLL